jgi:hypothetical protein
VEPIVGIQGLGALGECRRIGILKITKGGAGLIFAIATIVVVVGGNLSEMLERGEVGFTLGVCRFMVLHHHA